MWVCFALYLSENQTLVSQPNCIMNLLNKLIYLNIRSLFIEYVKMDIYEIGSIEYVLCAIFTYTIRYYTSDPISEIILIYLDVIFQEMKRGSNSSNEYI